MTELNVSLLGILTLFTAALVRAIRQPFPEATITRFLPIISIVVGLALSATWTLLGAEVPEGVHKLAYLGIHGVAAGLSASGLWSTAKAVVAPKG